MIDIILKKRAGNTLTKQEIEQVIQGYVMGKIPDYQMSALLMAIYFQKLDAKETSYLTQAMLHSGVVIDLSSIHHKVIDKHSTGGVGDKTSLIVGPLVAAMGIPVAKMSGSGLGHTGGTLDKLESIDGFKIKLEMNEFLAQVKDIGIAICGQTADLVPADKMLYALRDVTGTIDNISLIASSIMSKKLASGAAAIVIDIKIGDGAFMKTIDQGRELALLMQEIARHMGKEFTAVLTSMQQPLGNAIGNALEVIEAIHTLQGNGPKDLLEVSLALGTEMLLLSDDFHNADTARVALLHKIENGEAFQVFRRWIERQHGDIRQIDDTTKLPHCKYTEVYTSKQNGFISEIKASQLGMASMKLGAGRETKESILNYGAGIILHHKVGEWVEVGTPLCTMYADDSTLFHFVHPYLDQAYIILPQKSAIENPIYEIIK